MKKRIKKFNGERILFNGILNDLYIEKDIYGNQIEKVKISNIKSDNGLYNIDNCYFIKSKEFENFKVGENITFYARVTYNTSGYLGDIKNISQKQLELKLIRPTKIRR